MSAGKLFSELNPSYRLINLEDINTPELKIGAIYITEYHYY